MIPSDPYTDSEPGEPERALLVILALINLGIWGYVVGLT